MELIERVRSRFGKVVRDNHLERESVIVEAGSSRASQHQGTTGKGCGCFADGLIKARVAGGVGHAAIDSPAHFRASLRGVISMSLASDFERCVFLATVNAACRALGLLNKSLRCDDAGARRCPAEIVRQTGKDRPKSVGLFGFEASLLEMLVRTFGGRHVACVDADPELIGARNWGVDIWDAHDRAADLVDRSEFLMINTTCFVNASADEIVRLIWDKGCPYRFFGITGAGATKLLKMHWVCPFSQ